MRVVADVRYAIRMLRKAPGASAVAVVSLALGIAITTTVFGWIRGILLDPVPGVDASRIVTVETVAPSGTLIDSSFPDYQDVRDRTTTMDGVIAFKERSIGLGTATTTERAWALMVTGNYFDVLGVKPALGRFFDTSEQRDTFDAHPVAILGYTMWRARFHADPRIVGQTIALNRRPYTVIGVAPDRFNGTINGLRFDLYVPLTNVASLTGAGQWLASRGSRPLYLFGRLKPGVTVAQARADVASIAARAAQDFARTNRGIALTVLPLSQATRGAGHDLGPLLRILFAAGAIVLLIVCANVANLQLARAASRQKEISIRLGLGASRGVLAQQLLTEGLVLGAIAGTLAVFASAWLADSLRWLLPFEEYPIALPSSLQGQEIAFAVLASIVASILFTLAPTMHASANGIVAAINESRQAGDRRSNRVGAILVGGQVALAMAAVVTAVLLLRSFDNARRVNPGFNTHNVLLVGINLSTAAYSRLDGLRFLDRIAERARALPGVQQVALSGDVPLGFNGGSWEDLQIDGYVPSAGENMRIYRNQVGQGYFDLMGIRRVEGRDFTDRDTPETPLVAVVNETFARRYLATGTAIGRQFTMWGRAVTIVGVVADSKYHALDESAQPYFYLPLKQTYSASTGVALHVRTAGDPLNAAPAVREAMRAIDPSVPSDVVTTMADYTSASFYTQQIAATLLTVLGTLALPLSSLGLYSLIAYGVARRRREIGVRMALGATSSQIRALVVRRGLTLVGVGALAGSAVTVVSVRALASLLFGVSPFDVTALAAAVGLLTVTGVFASDLPARAAARVDPMSALRAD